MQIPVKKLVRLLQPDRPAEVRRAALVVLGELGVREADSSAAVRATLNDGDKALRLCAIQAVGRMRIEPALPDLIGRIREGGEEAEQAAHAAARLGAKGTRALQELMPKVAPGLRRYIAAALATGGTASSETAALGVLLENDPNVVEAAARGFLAQVPTLTAAQKKSLAEQLLQMLKGKTDGLSPATETAVVRLLVALDDPRAEAVLWDHVLPPHAAEVRAAALQALGKWLKSPGKERLHRLFTCAGDRDFRVAAPALIILRGVALDEKTLPEWLTLLRTGDLVVRRLAVEKLGDRDTQEVASALAEQLSHPDRGLRDETLKRLGSLKHGREALTRSLLEAETPDRAWFLAKAQFGTVREHAESWRDPVFKQACVYLEAEDRRADALLYVLREADSSLLRDLLEERAVAHRKKKAYAKALLYLKMLVRDPACGFDTRLEYSLCGLKESPRDLNAQARADDTCLHHLAGLFQHHEDELFPALEKVKWLDPEDLYYLGFHFAEQDGHSHKFGGQVLTLLVKRAGRTKLAQAAKAKLKSAGLG
jgi:HEAT repeat protein